MNDQIIQLSRYVFRNLRRHAFLSVLIVVSLATGLVSSFYVLSYVNYEQSYDQGMEHVYRINLENKKDGVEISRSARTSPAVGAFLKDNLPAVKTFSRMVLMGEVILKTDVDIIREKDVLLADSVHFDQFDYNWIHGSPVGMLNPQHVVLSESISASLFGDEDPTGRVLEINSTNLEGTFPFTVAGVFSERPGNSHLQPSLLISYATLYNFIGREIDDSWNWNNLFTYVSLDGDHSVTELSKQATSALAQLQSEQETERQLIFQQVADIHTDPGYAGEFMTGIDAEQLMYLLILSCFILGMTYLNFVNLFIVRTLSGARQMGIRAILGSSNGGLLALSIADIFLLNLISMILAITAIQAFNPYVISEFGLPADSVSWLMNEPLFVLGIFMGSVVISSIIPAIRFLRANWSRIVTSGKHTVSRNDIRWYGSLLGVQFFIALFFLSGLVVVYHQMWQLNNQDTGLNVENKWVIKAPFLGMELEVEHQDELLLSELQSVPGIKKLVAMNEIPGSEIYWRNDRVGRESDTPVPATFSWLGIGAGYMDLFEIEIIAGRDFDPAKDNYNSALILNESGMHVLGFTSASEAVGQQVFLGDHAFKVAGVVQDFHQEGFKKLVEPQYFRYAPNDLNYFVADIDPMPSESLIKDAYHNVFPGAPFEMYNLAEHYDKQYASDKLLARLILFLSVIALIIAVVGIVGMSLQILQKKSREMIIRKIHGATGIQLWNRVAFIFYRIALVAYLISAPVAFIIFNKWTERFTIGTFPVIEFLLLPAIILVVMVVLSITYQTVRLTRSNPKDVLTINH